MLDTSQMKKQVHNIIEKYLDKVLSMIDKVVQQLPEEHRDAMTDTMLEQFLANVQQATEINQQQLEALLNNKEYMSQLKQAVQGM